MARPVTVTYRVLATPGELAGAAAGMFAAAAEAAAAARGVARIAISGGSTPKAMFALLADRSQPYFARVPWDKLHLFWVDERCVPPTDPQSNYGMTKQAMLDHVPLPQEQIHRMYGEMVPRDAASQYETVLRKEFPVEGPKHPEFDFVQLGMGDDGHTASLFPHTEALDEVGRFVVANRVPQMETWRITLAAPVINCGREVMFLIQGADKAQVLHDVLLGPYDPESKPSQLIRPASGKLTLLLDAAAAAKLPAAAEGVGRLELK